MKNIAIIPARSGSKGLVNKNIMLLNEKPLLAYTVEAAIESNLFDTVMVSTDCLKYAEIAKQYGADVPFLRSPEMSSDEAGSWDVVNEVLNEYKKERKLFETVCLLQPTSPLRTSQDIINAYDFLLDKKGDAVTSVCEAEHSPLWYNTLPADMNMGSFIDVHRKNIGRQKLEKYYRVNGAIYIRKINYNNKLSLCEDKHFAYIMKKINSIDIDDEFDFLNAQFILNIKK